MRPSRLLAVARYEARTHMSGRQALRLLGVAIVLLLPASLAPTPEMRTPEFLRPKNPVKIPDQWPWGAGPPPPRQIPVRGDIPPALESRLRPAEKSPYEIRDGNPVVLVAENVPPELRDAMEILEGPRQVELRRIPVSVPLPGRSLLIAILAVSLLTGPLAEALPGERARRTLEVLMTAGLSRAELVGGKWLAWSASASLTALVAAALACWQGVQEVGWWVLGLPLFVASCVAFGMWLVRLVDDVVGGSAAPMRVLPVAATAGAVLARLASEVSPLAGAAVPIGGPLLLAADIYRSPEQALTALAGTAAFIAFMLYRTGKDLDRVDTHSSPTRWGAVGLCAVATVLWWLTVGGTGIWSSAGNTELVRDLPRSMMVGGLALLSCAVVAMAREFRTGPVLPGRRAPALVSVLATLGVGAALAASGPLPAAEPASLNITLAFMLERLREGALPVAMGTTPWMLLAGMLSIAGQALLFRGVVAARAGWVVASLMWCAAVCPWTPWAALTASFALGALAAGHGVLAAMAAQAIWALAAAVGPGAASIPLALALQAIALVISFAALRLPRAEPIRHQL